MPTIVYNNTEYKISHKIKVLELLSEIDIEDKESIIGVKVNNNLLDLNYIIKEDCQVEFVKNDTPAGNRFYKRSLFMLMAKAVYKIYGDEILNIEHSLSNGIYCELSDNNVLSKAELEDISNKMQEIVKQDYTINKHVMESEKGLE